MTLTFNGAQFGPSDGQGKVFTYFMNEVTKRTNGLIKFNYIGSYGLTKAGEEVTCLQTGIADIGNTCVVYFPTQLYINGGFARAVPFDVDDLQKANDIMYKLYHEDPVASKILAAEYEKQGLKFIGYISVDDSYVLESRTQITKLDDLKGKKIACIGAESPLFKPLGATVIGMPMGDRPTALQTGVLDAAATPFQMSYVVRIFEFAPWMISTGFGNVTGNPISMNMKEWNKLPKDIQGIILQVGKDAFKQTAAIFKDQLAQNFAARAKTVGDKPLTTFSAEDMAKWASLVGEPVADWVKNAPPGVSDDAATVVERFIALQKEAGIKFPREWKIRP